MIAKEYAVEICRLAVQTEDEIDMQVAADALEELGDIRGPMIRSHLKCCFRGINIIMHFLNYRTIFLNEKDFPKQEKDDISLCNKTTKMCYFRTT
jgi:hypothetical protein